MNFGQNLRIVFDWDKIILTSKLIFFSASQKGIAVGEINTVLQEADIQQKSMRIVFVLKVQETLNHFNQFKCLKFLHIRFEKYNYDDEFRYIKTRDKLIAFFGKHFKSSDPSSVGLVDPIKRLDDNLVELSRMTTNDMKTMREILTNQINDVETKLSNSQQRLEDILVEILRKTTNNFETTKEDTLGELANVENNLGDTQKEITNNIQELNDATNQKMDELKESYESQFAAIRQEMNESLTSMTDQVRDFVSDQISGINGTMNGLFDKLSTLQQELDRITETQKNLIDLNRKLESNFQNFIIDHDVKEVLDKIVDQLLEDGGDADKDEDFEELNVEILRPATSPPQQEKEEEADYDDPRYEEIRHTQQDPFV